MQPTSRVTSTLALALGLSALLSACSGEAAGPTPTLAEPIESVQVTPDLVAGLLPGDTVRLTATLRDPHGAVLTGRSAAWSSADPAVASVSATGLVTARSPGGPVAITATSEGKIDSASITVVPVTPLVPMLNDLTAQIAACLRSSQEDLPRNPLTADQIRAKIAMLQRPTLEAEIRKSRYWETGSHASVDGRQLPIAATFALDTMRAGAAAGLRSIESALRYLEGFLGVPFPNGDVRMWYGFKLGNSGGGGSLWMEDKGTYVTRPPGTKLEYDAIFGHELAHSYVGNESLTQFLEVYVYNRVLGRTDAAATWTFKRGWSPGSADNRGVHALLDIYALIGREAMANAYRAILPLHPPYGSPVSAQVQQAFIDSAPAQLRTEVAVKAAMIGT